MNNFNWNNYIGEPLSEPLRVTLQNRVGGVKGLIGKQLVVKLDNGKNRNIKLSNAGRKNVKPLIKSPADLTDDEWLFVFGGNSDDYFIHDRKYSKHFKDYETETLLNRVMKEDYSIEGCNQQILNRLYSLHVSLDYEELINNNKAVRKP